MGRGELAMRVEITTGQSSETPGSLAGWLANTTIKRSSGLLFLFYSYGNQELNTSRWWVQQVSESFSISWCSSSQLTALIRPTEFPVWRASGISSSRIAFLGWSKAFKHLKIQMGLTSFADQHLDKRGSERHKLRRWQLPIRRDAFRSLPITPGLSCGVYTY